MRRRRCSRPPADPRAPARDRPRRRRAAAAPPWPTARAGFPSTRPRSCFARPALPVVEGRLVSGEDDAVVALSELGGHVARQAERALVAAQGRRGRPRSSTCAARRTSRAAHRRPRRARRRGRRRARRADGAARRRAARGRARATPWCRASWSAPAASGPRRSTTRRWCRCPPRPSAWRRRSARCARRALFTRRPRAARRSTWPPPPGWPRPPASCCSRAGSSCSS